MAHHGERHIHWWKIGFPCFLIFGGWRDFDGKHSKRYLNERLLWACFWIRYFPPFWRHFMLFCFPLYVCRSVFSLAASHGNMWKIFPQKCMYTLFHWPSAMRKLIMVFLFWGTLNVKCIEKNFKQRSKWKKICHFLSALSSCHVSKRILRINSFYHRQ